MRACAIVTCSACYAFCACRKSASKSASRTACCAFCALCVCCLRSARAARAACNEATRAARIVPRGALPDRCVPSVDNGIYARFIFLCLPRAEQNQRFLFVKNESVKFCCSGGFSNVPDVMEPSVLFISTVFHVRSVSCRCLYLGFRAPCAAPVTRVTCSKRSLLGVPLELA